MALHRQRTARHLGRIAIMLACALALPLAPTPAWALSDAQPPTQTDDVTAAAVVVAAETPQDVPDGSDDAPSPDDAEPTASAPAPQGEGEGNETTQEPQGPGTDATPGEQPLSDTATAPEEPGDESIVSTTTDSPDEGVSPDDPTAPAEPASEPTSEPASDAASTAPADPAPDPTPTAALATQATSSLPDVPAGATAAVTDGRTYVIQSLVATTRVVTAEDAKAAAGTDVISAAYKGKNAQKWVAKREGSSLWYRLLLAGSGGKLALGVSGSNVCITKNPTGKASLLKVLWAFVSTGSGSYRLVNATATSKALTVPGSSTAAGTSLSIAAASSSKPTGQRFHVVDAQPQVKAGTSKLAGAYTVASSSKKSLIAGTKSASRGQNAPLTLQVSDGTRTQHIYLEPDGTGYYIAWVVGSGRVLTVAGASILPGTKIVQRAWQKAEHQRWAVVATKNANGTYTATLQNKGTGLFLGAASTTSGTAVTGQAKGGDNTKLTLTKQGLLKAGITCITPLASTKTALSIPGAKTGTSKVVLWTNSGALNQRFELVSAGSNLWRIRTASSGGWLTWKSGATVVQTGTGATAKSKANTWKAIWKNGGISLVNQASGKALQMSYGKTAKGTKIVVYKNKGTKAQHFVYTPASLIADGVYLVNSKWEGRRLRVDGAAKTPANISNPTFAKTVTDADKFKFTSVGTSYKITNVKSGLPVTGGGFADAKGYANVSQKRNKGTKDQLWQAKIGDGGYVEFVNVASGKYLVSRNNNSKSADGVWPAYNVVERAAKDRSTYATGCSWKLKATTGAVNTSPFAKTTVLMIGNSFTGVGKRSKVYEAVQDQLGKTALVDWSTESSTTLAQHYETDVTATEGELAAATLRKLYFGDWDVVVLQEKTSVPLDEYPDYLASLKLFTNLCKKVKAKPVIYATYAFAGGSGGANERKQTLAQMHAALQANFTSASKATGAVIANVGAAFNDRGFAASLYDTDNKHPSAEGCTVAGNVIAITIRALLV